MNHGAENGAGTPLIPGPGETLIPLTQGRFALVDEIDAAWLSQWKWCASITAGGRYVYAARRGREDGKFRLIYMHRAILGAPRGLDVDHISGDTLDNRRRPPYHLAARRDALREPDPRRPRLSLLPA